MSEDDVDNAWEQVAMLQTELAALLSAGLQPATAWNVAIASLEQSKSVDAMYLVMSDVDERRPLADSLVVALTRYRDNPGRFRNTASKYERERIRPLQELVAVIVTAEKAGLPLRPVLERLASTAMNRADHERSLRVIRQAPKSSAKLLQLLPFVGIVLGMLIHGPQMLRGAVSPLGMFGLGIAVCCMLLAAWWNRRIMRSLDGIVTTDATFMRLIALALQGPGSLANKLLDTDQVIMRLFGESLSNVVRREIERLAQIASVTGMPLVRVLERTAELVAARQLRELQRRAKALEVRLLLPLGLLGIPAFLLMTVVPFVAGLMQSTISL